MLKSSAFILLFSTCLVMQYAMQFAYLQCKIENSVSSQPACDCEKKYVTEKGNDDNEIPLQKNHTHLAIDVFLIPVENKIQTQIFVQASNYFNKNISFFSKYCSSIFHPPQSC